jgi:hypothetical protein
MDYDFASLAVDQIDKIQKRLKSLNKSFIKEYKVALNVINNAVEREHRTDTIMEIEDILNAVAIKCEVVYRDALAKSHNVLERYL